MLRVAFVLPKPPYKINGGYKIVYQFAGGLAQRGYKISIYYDLDRGANSRGIPRIFWYSMKKMLFPFFRWYNLPDIIQEKVVYDINDKYLEDQDAIFATALCTSSKVDKLSNAKFKHKYYLVQGFEAWAGVTKEQVYATYNFNMDIVTISRYLYDKVIKETCNKVYLIRNGIDFSEMGVDIPIEKRNSLSIAFLYHASPVKGTWMSLNVVNMLKVEYPDLSVKCFGTVKPRPHDLPEWIEYTANASRVQVRNILNESAIFLCGSVNEGFGLTGAESMACGCALVSTAYPAVYDYAVDKRNALLSPINSPMEMFENAKMLLMDYKQRIEIASAGVNDIHLLDFNRSIDQLDEILKN